LTNGCASWGVGHVIVTGLATEFCIDSTCRAALSRGYDLTLVEDGHSTPAPSPDSGLTAETIVTRYDQVLSWADNPTATLGSSPPPTSHSAESHNAATTGP
jgi:nicotinamidase-related amidase